jgi:hypothetical protein
MRLKWILKKRGGKLDSFGSGADSFEHGDELSGFIKDAEFSE